MLKSGKVCFRRLLIERERRNLQQSIRNYISQNLGHENSLIKLDS